MCSGRKARSRAVRSWPRIKRLGLELVSKPAQQLFTCRNLVRPFNAFGLETVHHAEDAAPEIGLREDYLRWVGCGTENPADFRHSLNGLEHVHRVEALPQEEDKAVSGG